MARQQTIMNATGNFNFSGNFTSVECTNALTAIYALGTSLALLAIIIVVVLSFTQKRVRLLIKCCWARPSLVIPLNMVNSTPHRFIYTIIFGSISSVILTVLLNQNINLSNTTATVTDPYSSKVLSIIAVLLIVSAMSIAFYPLFACVNSPELLLGHILGFLYSILWFGFYFTLTYYRIYNCPQGFVTNGSISVAVLVESPILLLNLAIVIWYGTAIVCHFVKCNKSILDAKTEYHNKSVKYLLKKKYPSLNPYWIKLKYYLNIIYPYNPSFKFPLRFLVTMIISFVGLYQLFLQLLFATITFSVILTNLRNFILLNLSYLVNFDETTNFNVFDHEVSNITELVSMYGPVVADSLLGPAISFPIAVIASTLFCFILMLSLFRSVSVQLQQLKRGEKLIVQFQDNLHKSFLYSVKYPGYQVAFTIFTWIIYIAALIVFALIIQIAFYAIKYATTFVLPYLIPLLITLVWSQFLYWFQFCIYKFVLIKKDSSHLYTITNRRFLHWFAYVFLFQNILVGIFSSILRLFYSVVFGFFLLMKLDRPLLMKGFERFDKAHNTYLGFLWLEYSQNNSIVNVFCDQLWELIKRKQQLVISSELEECINFSNEESKHIIEDRPRVSQRAYNRWHVVYTLLRNEQLVKFRKSKCTV